MPRPRFIYASSIVHSCANSDPLVVYIYVPDAQLMKIPVIILFSILILVSSCDRKECPVNFDFSKEEMKLIPYKTDSLLIFTNENAELDTFYTTRRSKQMVDEGFQIETPARHWLEIEIRYTNKRFAENPGQDRQLAWITKGCKDQQFDILASWMDFWDGLSFRRNEVLTNYSYPDTIKKFAFNGDTLFNVLKFETNILTWPGAADRNVKTVYWLTGEGVIMYETRKTGTWKKLR